MPIKYPGVLNLFFCLFVFHSLQISLEVQKLPQSRFLPRPPNHTARLNIEDPSFQPKTSADWLKQNGLKGNEMKHVTHQMNQLSNCTFFS